MAAGVSAVLGSVIGIAISPIPITAVILMLFSPRARVTGPMFVIGWVVTLAVLSSAAYLLAEAGDAATDATTADGIGWGRIVVGTLFLLLAVRQWRNRPAKGAPPQMPAWMGRIDSFGAGQALGLAVLLAGVNPKNLLLSLAAGSALAAAGPSAGAAIVSTGVFLLVSSLTVAVPVGYYLAARHRAKAALDSVKSWLTEHNAAVMTVLFLVLGGNLIANGLLPLGS